MARTCTPSRRFAVFVVLITLLILLNAVMLYRVAHTAAADNVETVSVVKESQTTWLETMHTWNAINSWLALDGVKVILFGDEASCAFAAEFLDPSRGECLPIPCFHEELHVPRYDCLFKTASERATTELLMYSNSDMVYFNDLLLAMDKVASEHYDFLMVGQRIDILYPRLLQFTDPNWAYDFQRHVAHYGAPHGKFGIDYFLYRTALSRDMPPFIVGRVRWDNWLLAQFIGNQDAVAVDSTRVVMAVHLNHMRVGDSHSRSGTDYNINLTKADLVDPKKIGDIEMCDYVLAPIDELTVARQRSDEPLLPVSCPACKLVPTEQSLDVMLYKHSREGNIIIATITSGYIDFAMNWLCSLRRVDVRNFLFHAADETLYRRLLSMGVPVVYYESEQAREFRLASNAGVSAMDYGSVAYQALMNTRTEFIYKILQKGYNVLLCDVDIIFLRDPFPFFDMSLDIQGGAHKKTKITGGFVFFRATPAARTVWVKVLLQHRDMFKKIQTMTEFNPHSMTEQELLNQMLVEAKNTDLKWGLVDERVIADGKRFFIDKLTQKNGEWPAAIHNNFIVGADNKRERFQNISMWMVRPDLTCRPFPHYLPAMPRGPLSFIFKIITFNRPVSLTRLMESLLANDYQGDVIPLEIYIDAPANDQAQDDTLLADHAKVIELSNAFEWPHGPKKVILREQHFGLVNQWLNSWFPTSDSEFALFLEDDNVVVTGFYEFMKRGILHYQFNPDNYDARVFGFNMQHQHMIPGRYPKKPSEFLDKGTLYYKYQLLSTWGPIFYPTHWSEFITWFAEKSANEQFMPLFSNMVTNDWFMKRGGGRSVWSAWFMRFAAERGLYAIYTNFPNEQSFIVNYRDKGVNFKEDKGPNSNPAVLTEEMLAFPPGAQLPIYDFHFNQIVEDPSILEDRATYADTYNIEVH